VDAWWVRPQELAPLLLKNPNVTGLTFSGGEPMDQAAGLSALVQLCRQIRDVNVICFSGYTYEQLLSHPEDSVVHALLAEIDVLIDGPYIEALNDDLGLRGSSNQRVIHLSDKLKGFDLDHAPRHIELFIKQDSTMMIGVPPREVLSALEHTFDGHNRRDGK
jgi:anaerobic ribonucleoside-triphosphate reductase activating protein